MNEIIYRKLADHLDTLPDGFPPSSTGADLRLLELLFTSKEAELAVHTTLERESAETLAARASLAEDTVRQRLDEMAKKGLIISVQTQDGSITFQAVPFVVGIYEFQVKNLSPEFLKALDEYWSTTVHRPQVQTIPQMRTIPINKSIDTRLETMTYDQVGELVANQTRFAVAPCICRRRATLKGAGCDAPEESCLVLGDWADYYIRTERGREVDRAEMQELLIRADAASLVLQPSNSQRAEFICCCCGCCCGVLRGIKQHPRPADMVINAFMAALNVDLCEGCFTCLQRCQMDALLEDGDKAAFKSERCIGCGLCVTTCPSGALTLLRKPGGIPAPIPATLDETWSLISRAQQGL